MTEENIRLESDSDETVSETESADGVVSPSPKTEFTPLIPGTEIIGRRARRAAMMREQAEDQTPLSESESEEDDQIPLWDSSAFEIPSVPTEDDVDLSPEQMTLEESTLWEEVLPAEDSADGEEVTASASDGVPLAEELPAEDSSLGALLSFGEDAYYTPVDQIPRRRRNGGVGEPVSGEEVPSRRGRSKAEKPAVKRPCAVSPFVEFVEIVVGALVAAILVLTLICRTGVVEGASMAPTMHEGDRYIISDLFYTPDQGDIVVFRPEIDGEDELWIKRVIALEGQTVYIDPDSYRVYVDGELLDEPYLGGAGTIPHTTENPITVPEGCVYVLGDNRAISHDSRYEDLGCVEIGQLAGHVILRFWPLEDFGFCE